MPNSFRTMLLTASILMLLSTIALYRDLQVISLARAVDLDHGYGTRWKEASSETIQEGPNKGFFANATTLEEVWSELKRLAPLRGSNGYVQPAPYIFHDFERVVLDMLTIGHDCVPRYDGKQNDEIANGCPEDCPDDSNLRRPPSACDSIELGSLRDKYRIGTFVDTENRRNYCILATTSILYPWGNVIVDLDTSAKKLSFDCPHPLFDAETGEQGIRLLKGTRSRSWIVAGSHRMANNSTEGTCQPPHYPSDAAHSIQNCFLAAVAAVKFYYGSVLRQDYTSVQLHGMGSSTCGDVDTFFSHGSCDQESDMEKIDILQRIADLHPLDDGWHAVAGRNSSRCNLCGTTNIQGRLINGAAKTALCTTPASSYNQKFIQIEQKRDYRRASKTDFWNNVFNEAYNRFPAIASTSNVQGESGDGSGDQECSAS